MPLPFSRMTLLSLLLLECLAFDIKEPENSILSECVSQIIRRFPGLRKASIFGENSTLLTDLLERLQVPATINVVEPWMEMDTRRKSDLVLILGRANVTSALMRVLRRADSVVITARNYEKEPEEDIEELWAEKIVNGFIAVERMENVTIFSYEPYEGDSCKKPKLMMAGNCVKGQLKGEFQTKKIKNGNHCDLDATVANVKPYIIFPVGENISNNINGFEASFFEEYAKMLNFTPTFTFPADGFFWGQFDPPTGMLGNLALRRSDFAFGAIIPALSKLSKMDLSRFYDMVECVTFLVPTGAGQRSLDSIYPVHIYLSLSEWIQIFLSFFLVTIIFCFHLPPMRAFLIVFSSSLGNSVKFPKNRIIRHLLLIWITYSLFLTSVMKAFLGSMLAIPVKSPEIETLQDLVESNLKPTGHTEFYRDYFRQQNESYFQEMANRFSKIDLYLESAVPEMMRNRTMSFVAELMPVRYLFWTNPSLMEKIHVLRECFIKFSPVAGLQKNSPFTSSFDDFLSRAFESGISNYWKSLFVREAHSTPANFASVQFKQFYFLLPVLFGGQTLAFFAFLVEIAVFRWKHRKNFEK